MRKLNLFGITGAMIQKSTEILSPFVLVFALTYCGIVPAVKHLCGLSEKNVVSIGDWFKDSGILWCEYHPLEALVISALICATMYYGIIEIYGATNYYSGYAYRIIRGFSAFVLICALGYHCIMPFAAGRCGTETTMTATVVGKKKAQFDGSGECAVRGHNGITATVSLPDKKWNKTDKGDKITVIGKELKTPMGTFWGSFHAETGK